MTKENAILTRSPKQRSAARPSAIAWMLLIGVSLVLFGSHAHGQGIATSTSQSVSNAPASTAVGTRAENASEAVNTGAGPTVPATGPVVVNGQPDLGNMLQGGPKVWTSPQGISSAMQVLLLLTVLTLAPAILLMTTSFVRIVVVLGLLRQAMGTQQLPPSQVITSLALFMTLFIMAPTWRRVYEDSIRPYTTPGSNMSMQQAWEMGSRPIRQFMSRQIDIAGNSDDVWLFYRYSRSAGDKLPETYDDVPTEVLLPAFMLSELKTSFLMGFQIYLPFLILDMVISSVTIAMGMVMLPPVMISLPFKLLLFVLVDGWHLVVGMLLESFGPLGPGG